MTDEGRRTPLACLLRSQRLTLSLVQPPSERSDPQPLPETSSARWRPSADGACHETVRVRLEQVAQHLFGGVVDGTRDDERWPTVLLHDANRCFRNLSSTDRVRDVVDERLWHVTSIEEHPTAAHRESRDFIGASQGKEREGR